MKERFPLPRLPPRRRVLGDALPELVLGDPHEEENAGANLVEENLDW